MHDYFVGIILRKLHRKTSLFSKIRNWECFIEEHQFYTSKIHNQKCFFDEYKFQIPNQECFIEGHKFCISKIRNQECFIEEHKFYISKIHKVKLVEKFTTVDQKLASQKC